MRKKKTILFSLMLSALLVGGSLVSCSSLDDVVGGLLGDGSTSTDPVTYTVTYAASSDYTVSGLASSYEAGDTVTFAVTVTNDEKELSSVAYNGTVLTTTDGTYTFNMPSANVVLTITLEDAVVKYTVTYETSGDYTLSIDSGSRFEAGETVSFTVTLTNSEKVLSSVSANDNTLGETDGTYSFTMPETDVTITVELLDVEYSLAYKASENDPSQLTVLFTDSDFENYITTSKAGDTVVVYVKNGSDLHTVNAVYANTVEATKLNTSSMYYSFTMPSEDVEITIDWTVTPVNAVTYETSDDYTISINNGKTYAENETVSFTVTAVEGKLVETVKANDDTLTADENGVYSFTMPSTAVVITVEVVDDPTYIDSLEDLYALASLTEGEYAYVLASDLELTQGLVIQEGVDLTLDLSGHTLTLTQELKTSVCADESEVNWLIENYGNLTLNDSFGGAHVAGGTGALRSYSTGSIEINNGITFSSYQACGHSQTVYITSNASNPSVINSVEIYSSGLALAATNTTVNDAIIVSISNSQFPGTGYAYAVWAEGCTFNNGEVFGIQGGIAVYGGDNVFNGISSSTDVENAIRLFNTKMEETGQTEDLNYPFIYDVSSVEQYVNEKINLNYFTTVSSAATFYGLYIDSTTATVKITAGSFSSLSKYAIYACCYSSIEIEGGSFGTVNGTNGVLYITDSSKLTITGGSFKHLSSDSHTTLEGYIDSSLYEVVDSSGWCEVRSL